MTAEVVGAFADVRNAGPVLPRALDGLVPNKQMKRLGKFCTSFVVLLSFPPDSLGYTVANQEVVGTKMLLILRCSQHRNIQQYDMVLEMDLRTLQRSVGSNMLLVVISIFKPIK